MLQLLAHVPQGSWTSVRIPHKQAKFLLDVHEQDKAVRRFTVRNMVETAAIRDLSDASVYPGSSSSLVSKTSFTSF